MNYKVIYTPGEENIEQLKKWFINGKFPWTSVFNLKKGAEDGELIIITFNEEAIGYLLYIEEPSLKIYIRETQINPEFQRQGFGRQLVKNSIAKFKEEGKSMVYLKSVYNSESFWNKMGFNDSFIPEDIDYNAIFLRKYLK